MMKYSLCKSVHVPDEMWISIMEFVDTKTLVQSCSLVSQGWYRLANSEPVWEAQASRLVYPQPNKRAQVMAKNFSWREYFVTSSLLRQGSMEWESLKSDESLKPRYRHTSTTLQGDTGIVMIGGQFDDESFEGDGCFLYTPSSNTFTPLPHTQAPLHLSRHTSVEYNGKIWVFGGRHKKHEKINRVFTFDLATRVWEEVFPAGNAPTPRTDHGVALVGNRMFVVGGSSPILAPIEGTAVLNLDTLVWEDFPTTGEEPPARSGHCVWEYGGKIYVFGGGQWYGKNQDWDQKFNDMYILDTNSREWSRISSHLGSKTPAVDPSSPTNPNQAAPPSPSAPPPNLESMGMMSGIISAPSAPVPALPSPPPVSTFVANFVANGFAFFAGGSSLSQPIVTEETHVFDCVAGKWLEGMRFGGSFGRCDSGSISLCGDTAYLFHGYAGGALNKVAKLSLGWKQKFTDYTMKHNNNINSMVTEMQF